MARKGGDNLKRGTQKPGEKAPYVPGPQPHGGYLAPPATDGANFQKAHDEAKRIKDSVLADPGASLEEIHAALTLWTTRIVKRGARSTAAPDPATLNVIREFRQTQEAVNEARRAKGAIVEAREFFATMDERAANLMRLAPTPVPVAELE